MTPAAAAAGITSYSIHARRRLARAGFSGRNFLNGPVDGVGDVLVCSWTGPWSYRCAQEPPEARWVTAMYTATASPAPRGRQTAHWIREFRKTRDGDPDP